MQIRMHLPPQIEKEAAPGSSVARKKKEGKVAQRPCSYATLTPQIGLDVSDGVFDYVHVAALAQHQETRKHAAWLGVCTTIALLLELVVKTKLRRRKDKETAEERGERGIFDMNDKEGRNFYIFISGMMELVIFLVEDATTVFVWWQTGTYDFRSGFAKANLITTVVSAVGAAIALVYGMIRFAKEWGEENSDGWVGIIYLMYGIPAALFFVALVFWAVVALTTIQGGNSYDCLDSCVVNATAAAANTTTTTLLAGSDALVLGSGSSFGSGESGAGEGGNDVGLNRAAIGMYVVGWIVAVLGGGYTTLGVFE